MNKKGEVNVGMLITLAIALIVSGVLLAVIAQELGPARNTEAMANYSLSTVVNGTAQYVTGYRSLSDVVVYNESNNVIVAAANYTVTNNINNNGALEVQILPNASEGYKSAWQVSGTAQRSGYIDNSGGRAMASLIIILAALAMAVVAMSPTARSGLVNLAKG